MSVSPPPKRNTASWGPTLAFIGVFTIVVGLAVVVILLIHNSGPANNAASTPTPVPGNGEAVTDTTGKFTIFFPAHPARQDTTTITPQGNVQHTVYTVTTTSNLGTSTPTNAFSAGYTIYPAALAIGDPQTFLSNAMHTQILSVKGAALSGAATPTTVRGKPALEFTLSLGGVGYGRTALILSGHTLYEIEVVGTDPALATFEPFLQGFSLLP